MGGRQISLAGSHQPLPQHFHVPELPWLNCSILQPPNSSIALCPELAPPPTLAPEGHLPTVNPALSGKVPAAEACVYFLYARPKKEDTFPRTFIKAAHTRDCWPLPSVLRAEDTVS